MFFSPCYLSSKSAYLSSSHLLCTHCMDPSFWNSRFDRDHFVYGASPNAFIAAQIAHLPKDGTVLDLAGGEGRNAIYLAREGYDVTLLDYSEVALKKAVAWAKREGVALRTQHADLTTWTPERTYDAVVASFVHLPVQWQPQLYETMQAALAPGGTLIAEWFRPEQRTDGYTSGGPPNADMMMTADELRGAFPHEGIELLSEPIVSLDEGPGHSGPAAVVRLVWTRPSET